jgi:O-antigen/teichoic acid export membrane protein
MKPASQAKNLMRGTFILTIAALFTKILSAFYRIPFQNIVGDVGFYIYQQVYPFYAIAIALSTYGFPVVISKLYAEETNKKEGGNLKQLFIFSAVFLFGFGLLGFILLYGASDSIALFMQDPKLAPLLKMVSFVFILMPVISLLRGFFQGQGEMLPTAVSQVSEQLVRVVTILATAIFLSIHQYSLYMVGAGAVFGSITGGLVAVIVLLFFWLRSREERLSGEINLQQGKKIIKAFTIHALPICISSMLLVLLQLADSLNLFSLLVQSSVQENEAKALKGVYDRGQPLIQLGTVVATSMSLSLVPLITKEKMQNSSIELKEKIQFALKTSIVVGVGATMGLYSIIKPTNIMLFENEAGSQILALLTLVILFASVIMTITAILQGLGHTLFPAIMVVVAFLLKYSLNVVFVPKFGAFGAALASVLSLLMILVLFIVKLHKLMGERILTKRFYWMNGLAALVMVVVLKVFLSSTHFIYDLAYPERLMASVQALSAVLVGGLIYVAMIIKTNLLTEAELSLLPFGSKLMVFLPKKNRRGRVHEKD